MEIALRIKPDSPENHYKLGNLIVIKGRTEEALRHFREALRLDPSYHKAEEALTATTATPVLTDNERPSKDKERGTFHKCEKPPFFFRSI